MHSTFSHLLRPGTNKSFLSRIGKYEEEHLTEKVGLQED